MNRLIFTLLLLLSGSAQAALIKWTLQDVVTQFGVNTGTIEGYLLYDTEIVGLGRYVETNIRVRDTLGRDLLFDSVGVAFPEYTQILTNDEPISEGDWVLQLTYIWSGGFPDFALDEPGVILLDSFATDPFRGSPFTWYAVCNQASSINPRRCVNISPGLPVQSGQIVGSVVPIPPAAWLFISALAGLRIGRR